jgi:hypothetical protein
MQDLARFEVKIENNIDPDRLRKVKIVVFEFIR